MRKFFHDHSWFVLLLIVLIFGVPFLLHVVFKLHPTNSFFSAEWSAGDALTFYGALLAASGTVAGVFFTVRYSQRNYEEDLRKRVLPFITITELMSRSSYDPLREAFSAQSKVNDGKEEQSVDISCPARYEEYPFELVYFIYEEGRFVAKTGLPERYRQVLEHRGFEWRSIENGRALSAVHYLSFPLVIENVGNGTAINLRVGLNALGEDEKFLRPIQLNPRQTFYVHIFVPEVKIEKEKDYDLGISYGDIYNNAYRQDYPVTLTDKRLSVGFVSKQQLVEAENG